MCSGASEARGFKLRIGKYHFRLWRYGMEIGDNLGGRVWFFPWAPTTRVPRKKRR